MGLAAAAALTLVVAAPAQAIRGGEPVEEDQYPFIVEIQSFQGGEWVPTCTATLVDPRAVATAAHCIPGQNPRVPDVPIRLVFGREDVHEEPDFIVDESEFTIIVNSDWDYPNVNRDFAVLALNTPVTTIDPIQIASPDDRLGPGDTVIASGWGWTETGERTEHLRDVELPFVSNDPNEGLIAGAEGIGVSPGDSGGPGLTAENGVLRQHGVAAAIRVGDPIALSVYTDLTTPAPWEDITDELTAAGLAHLIPDFTRD